MAVSLAIEQAEILLQAVTEANGRLAADGHEFRSKIDLKRRRRAGIEGAPPDVPDLLAESQKAINNAREAVERQDYAEAWAQARRAQRPLRLVMHGHWQQAQEAFSRAAKKFYPLRPGEDEIDPDTDLKPKKKQEIPKVSRRPTLIFTPVSCPPLISFFTLAGALHLGRLDQGNARLSLGTKPRTVRRLRRPRGDQRVGLGRPELQARGLGRHGRDGRASRQPEADERVEGDATEEEAERKRKR